MKNYNKLVRNKIPEIIRDNGGTPVFRVIESDEAYLESLLAKDLEEGVELADNPCLEELADKLEVLHSIGKVLGYTPEEIEQARAKKNLERGGFEDRIFLERTE